MSRRIVPARRWHSDRNDAAARDSPGPTRYNITSMGKRVSRSLLDPFFFPLVIPLYRWLHIPRRFPPEGIILAGHIAAIAGAFGFAWSIEKWWGGLLAAAGVAANHAADMIDGTHARSTNQCRNGGELLDHFTDPLSFCYWVIGISVSVGRLDLALVCVICIYATAVLTNIRAKITGEFGLSAFGPTEFKTLLFINGLALSVAGLAMSHDPLRYERILRTALVWLWILSVVGVLQLLLNLVRAVREVNASGASADTTNWVLADRKLTDVTSRG